MSLNHPGSFRETWEGNDAFPTKLDPPGSSLVYSNFLAGGSQINSLALGSDGTVYATGETRFEDFPTTEGAFERVYNNGEPTPVRAPRANAFAERFGRTMRAESLDHILILGRKHLEGALRSDVAHYNNERPHRGIGLSVPEGQSGGHEPVAPRDVRRRDILGGLIHEYYGLAA
jgi:integrase-like protein